MHQSALADPVALVAPDPDPDPVIVVVLVLVVLAGEGEDGGAGAVRVNLQPSLEGEVLHQRDVPLVQ